jgi:hypothetical protein
MKKKIPPYVIIEVLALILVVSTTTTAATYYVAGSNPPSGWSAGSNNNNGSSKSTPKLTLQAGAALMNSGDTLIVADGTYTGSANCIDPNYWHPPTGTSGAWTVIKAEHDGGVILDGQSNYYPIAIMGNGSLDGRTYSGGTQQYIEIRGFMAKSGSGISAAVAGADHIKFTNIGAYDPGTGDTACFQIGYSTYVTLEGCFAFGEGRYKFLCYHANHSILRNCVSRQDYVNAGGDPMADFSLYSSTNIEVQNCIAIDGDDPTKWINIGEYAGSFACPTTSSTSSNGPINFTNCIALNNATRFGSSDNNTYAADAHWFHSIGWHLRDRVDNNLIRSAGKSEVNHCTFGDIDNANGAVDPAYYYGSGSNNISKNNIWYNLLHGGLFYGIESSSFNDIFGCGTVNVAGTSSSNTVTTNPRTGSLLYLPRIESGSALSNAGESGTAIGATIIKQYGKSGTLWGETGYNLLQDGTSGQTDVNIWPFPNEALIKSKLAAYSAHGVIGARGFATGTSLDGTAQTLTKYIWEYLGNPIPASVYSGGTGTSGCDINGDGSINILDYQAIAQALTTGSSSFNCDLNKDGSVNVLDLQLMGNIISGSAACPN